MMTILSLRSAVPNIRLSGSFVILVSFFGGGLGQTSPPQAVEVLARRPVSGEIGSGSKASFLFRSEAGRSIRGRVSQRGADVIVRVIPEGGLWTAEFDSVLRTENTESFEFVSDETGSYSIEIEGKRGTSKGSFELTVDEPTVAEERDRKVHRSRVLLFEAASHARSGKYADAIRTAEQVLSIREEVLGPKSPETAIIVNRLAIYHGSSGQHARALEYTKRALFIYEADPDTDPLVLADVLNNMGVGLRLQGDYPAAERYFKRVIEIREKAFGPEGLPLASTLNNLGLLYRTRADYESAEQTYLRSLRIREKHLGPEHSDVGFVLINLAALAFYKGDYSTALTLDRRVLDIRQKNLPPGHPLIAEGVYDIALLLNRLGDRENGEKMLLESLDLHEKAFKPGSSPLVKPLATIGSFYRESGDLVKARGFMDRALSIARVHQKGDPLELAKTLLYSARLRIFENDLPAAESELIESLAIQEGILGFEHIDVREVLNDLARFYAIQGNATKAVETQARANQIGERHLAINLNFGTEHQRLAFASLLSADLDQTLTLHSRLSDSDKVLREMAAAMLIQRKGRVLDATAGSLATLRAHLKPEDASLLTQLNDTTAQLSALMLSGPRSVGVAEFNARRTELQTRKYDYERELSRRSSGYYARPEAYSIADVKAAIPQDAALVEYALVKPEFATKKAGTLEYQYVAYIIRREGEIAYVKLGDARAIDKAIADLRRTFHSAGSVGFARAARKVNDLVLAPVRRLIGSSTHLLISPEGSLSVFPFEALVDDRGKFAVESIHFTYLTSGRDLFRLGGRPTGIDPPVIVADPSFGGGRNSPPRPSSTGATVTRAVSSVTTGKQLSDIYFAPLIGSAIEARNIRELFPHARLLTGETATVTSLRELKAPEMLHLATHGYFLEDGKIPGSTAQRGSSYESAGATDNPLVRSGLAFSGANDRMSEIDDGLLTAMEASGLNLWGTKLVVLSACDTGLGEIRNGEGVYGLRRSFVIAGAESLVMSLWPVSDQVTRELMTGYYKNLKKGMGRGEALRQVRLEMLKKPGRKHPFYWASFIQSGEWANLDGKR